jgi:TonB family protein
MNYFILVLFFLLSFMTSCHSDEGTHLYSHIPHVTVAHKIATKNDLEVYLNYVEQTIEHNKFYPKLAREEKHEGHCVLKFHIMRDGSIHDAFLETPTTSYLLNQAALEILDRIQHFEPFPVSLKEASIIIAIPLHYSLTLN